MSELDRLCGVVAKMRHVGGFRFVYLTREWHDKQQEDRRNGTGPIADYFPWALELESQWGRNQAFHGESPEDCLRVAIADSAKAAYEGVTKYREELATAEARARETEAIATAECQAVAK